jgi:hypothetical protein
MAASSFIWFHRQVACQSADIRVEMGMADHRPQRRRTRDSSRMTMARQLSSHPTRPGHRFVAEVTA